MISRTFVTRTPQVRHVQRPTLNPTFRTTYMCSCWPTPSTAPDPPPCLLWAQPTSTTTRKPRTLPFTQVDNTRCKGSLNFMMEINCNIFQFKNTCNVFPTDDGIFCFVYSGLIYAAASVGVAAGYMLGAQTLSIYTDFDKVNPEEQVIFFISI